MGQLLNKLWRKGAGCPAPFPLGLGLARRRRPEELEAFDDEVNLLDAVTLDVADPRSDSSLDVDLTALPADHPRGLPPGHDVVELGEAVDVGGNADVQHGLAVLGEPHLRVAGHPSEETEMVDPVRAGLRRGVDDVRLDVGCEGGLPGHGWVLR